jgi:hypothetical protein
MMAATDPSARHSHRLMAALSAFGLALAIAAFIIAMPQGAFESLISALGLPSVIDAAAPPLGPNARIVAAGIAALIAGGGAIAWLLPETPPGERLRRMINPIHASRELGDPEAAGFVSLDDDTDSYDGEGEEGAPISMVAAEAAEAAEKPGDVPIFVDFAAIRAVAHPSAEETLSLDQWRVSDAEIELTGEPIHEGGPQPAPIDNDASIPGLMRRLEAGLQARVQRGIPAHVRPKADVSRENLRETLDTLRKLASGR